MYIVNRLKSGLPATLYLTLAYHSLPNQAKHDAGTGVTLGGRVKRPDHHLMGTALFAVRWLHKEKMKERQQTQSQHLLATDLSLLKSVNLTKCMYSTTSLNWTANTHVHTTKPLLEATTPNDRHFSSPKHIHVRFTGLCLQRSSHIPSQSSRYSPLLNNKVQALCYSVHINYIHV